jgi:lactate dehydrogenase-like 2-hydroxyacid dehydrogenase
MEIYVISTDKDFTTKQKERLDSLGKVIFCDSLDKFLKSGVLKSRAEKIIAIRPSFCDYSFSNEIIDKINNLKAISVYTTSCHYLDLDYCKKKGIVVTNTPGYATDAIAEYLYFLALCCLKRLPIQIKYGKQEFSDMFLQSELRNKKVGIIGMGNIGKKIADMCYRAGNKIFYYSLNKYIDEYRMIGLQEIFTNCDVIFCTLTIDSSTQNLITDHHLMSMKKSAVFISGTGPYLHNHDLILDMVSKGKVFGYGLEEPNKTIMDYQGNVMVTSEYAWFTKEAKQKRKDIMIDGIESVIKNNVINRLV